MYKFCHCILFTHTNMSFTCFYYMQLYLFFFSCTSRNMTISISCKRSTENKGMNEWMNEHLPLLCLFLSYIQHPPPTKRLKTICATHATLHDAQTVHETCSWWSRTVPKFAEVAYPSPEEVFVWCRSWNVWI